MFFISPVKKFFETYGRPPLPQRRELLEPSTVQVDGRVYIISQSAIDNIIKSATFYNKPSVGDVFSNPLDRKTIKKLEKNKLPTVNRGMFSI